MADACTCISCEGRSCRICATCHDACAVRLANERFPVGTRADYALSGQEVADLITRRIREREGIAGQLRASLVFDFSQGPAKLMAVHVAIERVK